MTRQTDDDLDKQAIDLVASALRAPERGEDYGRKVWDRLQPGLAAARVDRRPVGRARFAPWALAAAVLVLVAGAFFAGRATQRQAEAPLSAEARRRVLLFAVGDHLERSRMVLLDFVNAAPLEVAGSRERARVGELVASNRLYRLTAVREGEPGIADVLDQLERVLLEIANGPARPTPEFQEALRRRIEEEGVLFKMQVIRARAGQRAERPAVRPPAVRS